jgi:hypothetical protein
MSLNNLWACLGSPHADETLPMSVLTGLMSTVTAISREYSTGASSCGTPALCAVEVARVRKGKRL